YSAGLFEVQKYVNLTGHVIGWVYVVIGEKQFQSMKPEFRKIILEAGKAMQDYHEKLFIDQEEMLKNKLKERGMEFIEVDLKAFQKKAAEAVSENISESIKPLYQQIINLPDSL